MAKQPQPNGKKEAEYSDRFLPPQAQDCFRAGTRHCPYCLLSSQSPKRGEGAGEEKRYSPVKWSEAQAARYGEARKELRGEATPDAQGVRDLSLAFKYGD